MRDGGRTVTARATGELSSSVGRGATCAIEFTRADAAVMVRDELDRWLGADASMSALDPLVLAQLVTHEVRWTGAHHLDPGLVADLAAVRDRHRGRHTLLDPFLDCLLAKHDGRYWNRTYLFLPLLEQFVTGPAAPLRPAELAALLAADVVRDELCAASRGKPVGPMGLPDPRTMRARLRHATRFMTAHLGAADADVLLAGAVHEPEAGLPGVLAHWPNAQDASLAEWLEVTAQPVSTVHDENFFIRALQAHEMAYTAAAGTVGDAAAALRDGQPDLAATLIEEVTAIVARGASLFRLIATMRREAFHTFRDFTEGASAIQSEQYKRFEARCGAPPPHRLGSPAFESVPAVKAEVTADDDSLATAWLDAHALRPADVALGRVLGCMAGLEATHLRWKAMHVTLATRMLGDATGSGYTSGVPYLRSWADHRLFWQVEPVAAMLGSTAAA